MSPWMPFHRSGRDAQLADELRSHLDMDEANRVARGESPRQAAASARRDFGNVGLVQELTRDQWAGIWLDRLWQDTRFGVRALWRTPAFTIVAVLCLAIGVGANAAVFSWTEGILFRPFPGVAHQDRLVAIAGTVKGTPGFASLSWPDFQDLSRMSTGFSAFVADKITGATITGRNRTDRAVGEIVSANYFDALGIQLARGRGFLPGEDAGNGAHPVVVISYAMWRDRFAFDPRIIGKAIDFNGVPHVIVGVASREFAGTFVGYAMQFWVPASMQATFTGGYELENRGAQWIEGFATLAPGVSRAEAQASISVAAKRLEQAFPDVERGRGIRVLPLWEVPFNAARELAPMLRVAVVVVVFVLLVACANVANLLLVRSFARRHEMTVRLAIGAGRARLLRQLVTEALVLGAIATVFGLAVGYACRHALTLFFPPRSGASITLNSNFDWRVLALSTGVGLAFTLLFALVPAIRASDIDLTGALKADAPSLAGGRRSSRWRAAMVMIQVAMSFALLVGGGLLFVSLRHMRDIDPGFAPDRSYTTYVNLLAARYDSLRARTFADRVIAALSGVSGVQSAALSASRPLDPGAPYQPVRIAVDGYQSAADEMPTASVTSVTPGYFATLGIPIVRGRDFRVTDDDTTVHVSIVSQTMAATYWPGRDPIGKRLRVDKQWTQVIGVARDIKFESLLQAPRPLFYVPLRQSFTPMFSVFVSSSRPAAQIVPAIGGAIHSLDPSIASYSVLPMRELMGRSTSPQRIAVTLIGICALLGVLLAAVGLYGVMSYVVSQSTRELGLRMALGAGPVGVLRLIMSRGIGVTLAGIAAGAATALGTTRLMGDLLYGIGPRDPLIFLAALLVMLGTATVACLVPGVHAARTDIIKALRV